MKSGYLVGLAALFLSVATPALAGVECNLRLVTSLPMGIDQAGGVYVPMQIDGRSVNLLVDTGGLDSMLTGETVKALGLDTVAFGAGRYLQVFGGRRIYGYATGRNILLGTLAAPHMRFLVMPDDMLAPEVQGTMAPDILRAYDDDFDFVNAKLNLISPDHCRGQVVYWTKDPPAAIPFTFDNITHIQISVLLDGKEIKADLDTGTSRTIFSLDEAERLFGFDTGSPALETLKEGGIARPYKFPFKTMTFGGVTVANPDIILVPDSESRMHGSDRIILGMGVLRQLHLYIAYREKTVYVTPASAH